MECCSIRNSGLSLFRKGRSLVGRRPTRGSPTRTAASQDTKQPWDIGRFAKTVLFFNNPAQAILDVFSGLSSATDMTSRKQIIGSETASTPIFLMGSDTEIGRYLLESMMQKGMQVETIVSDIQQSRASFESMKGAPGSGLAIQEWKQGDRIPRLPTGQSVIICESLKPYTAFLRGAVNEMDVYNPSSGIETITWGPLDDVVMGGCSRSEWTIQKGKGDSTDDAAVFSGNITSANNGGFTSVRTKNIDPPLDFTGYDGMKLRIEGDGQRYKFIIRTSPDWVGTGFCKSFDTKEGWQDVYLPFDDFFPVFRAKSIRPPPPLMLDSINSMQLMLSKFEYDGELNPSVRMGRFELPVESIKAYKEQDQAYHVVLANGTDEDKQILKTSKHTYTIVDADPDQTVALKDSTFIHFCMACLTQDGFKNATFKEKKRSGYEETMSVDVLLDYFEKQ